MANEHNQKNPPPPPRKPAHPRLPPAPLSRSQIEHLHLAGTVSIPRHFPDLGRIWHLPEGVGGKNQKYKPPIIRVVEHTPSHPAANVVRTILLDEVSAIFVPNDRENVQLSDGDFYLGKDEILKALHDLKEKLKEADEAVLGIVYVHETARVHTEVSIGMTAVRSVEFELPLGAFFCE